MNKWIYIGIVILLSACGAGKQNENNTHPSQEAPTTALSVSVEKNSDNQVVLVWQGQSTADSYTLYLSTNNDFPSPETETYQLEASNFLIDDLIKGETYFVKVVSIWNDQKSPESEVFSFQVPAIAPEKLNIVVDNNTSEITLQWQAVETAENYRVYWSLTDDVSTDNFLGRINDIKQNSLTQSLGDLGVKQGDNIYYIVTATTNGVESLVLESNVIDVEITEPVIIIIPPTAFSITLPNSINNKIANDVVISAELLVNRSQKINTTVNRESGVVTGVMEPFAAGTYDISFTLFVQLDSQIVEISTSKIDATVTQNNPFPKLIFPIFTYADSDDDGFTNLAEINYGTGLFDRTSKPQFQSIRSSMDYLIEEDVLTSSVIYGRAVSTHYSTN